ncbi:glycosyl transferase [Acinetobacter johnsonii]|nr:glycosyl transferase [Acinetobacter johnsonii]
MKSVNEFLYCKLSLCVVTLMLAACGGGDGDSAEAAPEVIESTLGYFDYDANSKTRVIRNDLTGSFEAMLQFGQSHVVDPNGNESKKMPRLTMEKEALLLVTPSQAMGTIERLSADIYMNNQWLRTIELDDPTHIPQSDQTNTDDRPRVQYSKRAWSARLNWDEIRPGLRIQLKDSHGRQGQIAEDKIDFASPGELVLNNIRIGMLTAPPVSNGHYMLNDPVRAGSDYFQTIPAAEMTVAKYDDIQLDRVMIADGTIYDTASASQGGVYDGDMRENVGKSTFSVGINLANWGITSASMASQNQPQLTQTVVAHHSRGKYANGESNHGLSGGNGMLTLYDSVGNEFSHEIGHHYGLGHYPGQEGDNQFWTSHHADSGWGYIPYRNMMRGNLIWNNKDLWAASTGIANFLALYPHSRDAMSGGYASSSVSRYTHYTGYSTYLKIQPHFNRYVWDKTSPTGYKKWNEVTRQMEVAQPTMPDSAAPVWYQPKQNYLRPRVFGEPVVTILGGYDPVAKVGLLYPAARSNWGNVYDLPAANTALNQDACWLNVQYPNTVTNIALAPTRLGSNANKLHVNLALADHPQKVDLYCKQVNAAAKLLSTTVIPQYATAITPAVKIGKAQGYKALRDVELPLLEQELLNQAANNIIVLSPNGLMLYQAYKSYKNEMSLAAQQVLERYGVQESKLMRLNRWVDSNYDGLAKELVDAKRELFALLNELGLQSDDPLAQSTLLKNNKNCLKTEVTANKKMDVYISGPSACTADDTEQWVYDSLGRIHSKAAMGQCLTGNGGSAKVTLTDCVANNAAQVWSMDATTSAIKQSGQCLDLNSGNLVNNRQIAIRYSCSGNNNQRWTMLNQNTSLILAGATSKNMGILVKNLKTQSLN